MCLALCSTRAVGPGSGIFRAIHRSEAPDPRRFGLSGECRAKGGPVGSGSGTEWEGVAGWESEGHSNRGMPTKLGPSLLWVIPLPLTDGDYSLMTACV